MTSPITVHVRVNDAATNLPTPVRLRIAGPGGEFFAPFGRSIDFPLGRNEAVGGHVYLGGKKYCYIDGACEIRLPTGLPLTAEISKGPEYERLEETVTLGVGQMALRFTIRRWADLRSEGWLSADTRSHFLSPHDALLEAAAEDIAFAHLLATEHHTPSSDGHLYRTVPNLSAFSGQAAALESAGHAVVVNTFNTHPALGGLGLLHSHRPVFPLTFGGDDSDDWSLYDWSNQCHRKGGLVVWCEPFRGGLSGGEALINLILQHVDALELDGRESAQPFLPAWYRLLNAGVRASLVGGSSKDSNKIALGSMRTYTFVPGPDRGLSAWAQQTRLGRCFVTNGPLLDLNVVDLSTRGAGRRLIQACARSAIPFDQLELVVNGEAIASASPTGSRCLAKLEHELCRPEGGWFALRCRGEIKSPLYPALPVIAHTSPVWIEAESKPTWTDPAAIRSLQQPIEEMRTWIERDGHFTNDKCKADHLDRCDQALRLLQERLRAARQ